MQIKKENEIAMKEELMEAFKVFDTDGLGYVPISEMRYNLRTYGIVMA
jgi:Ca2+-binding EF-hand superfamily protein